MKLHRFPKESYLPSRGRDECFGTKEKAEEIHFWWLMKVQWFHLFPKESYLRPTTKQIGIDDWWLGFGIRWKFDASRRFPGGENTSLEGWNFFDGSIYFRRKVISGCGKTLVWLARQLWLGFGIRWEFDASQRFPGGENTSLEGWNLLWWWSLLTLTVNGGGGPGCREELQIPFDIQSKLKIFPEREACFD